jgi:hypothetical protein
VRDSGSIVVGWLGKVALVLGLLGLLAYDGFAVVVANFNAADHAATAAHEAADSLSRTGNVQTAYDAAVAVVDGSDKVEANTFSVDDQGRVTVFVEREAKTLWLQRVGPLKKWTQARQSGTGAPGA